MGANQYIHNSQEALLLHCGKKQPYLLEKVGSSSLKLGVAGAGLDEKSVVLRLLTSLLYNGTEGC